MNELLYKFHYMYSPFQHQSDVVEVVKPFDLVYKLMTTRFKQVDTVSCGSPFILMTEISCTSPWKLLIVESVLKPVLLWMCILKWVCIYDFIHLQSNDVEIVGKNFSQVEGCECTDYVHHMSTPPVLCLCIYVEGGCVHMP